jgi:hypothetical protein
MRLKESNNGLPIVRRSERKLKLDFVSVIGPQASLPQLRGSSMKAFLESSIESSERGKTGGPRHRHNRHSRFNDQLAGEIEPVVVRDLFRRLADFFLKESAQMSCAHTQAFGEPLLVRLMKLIPGDELERPLNDRFFSPPRRRQRSTFRTAPQTRSVSCQLRRGGVGEELDVLALRSRRTNRPAVNTCRLHRDEEFAVETAVPCEHGLIKIVHRKPSIGANGPRVQDTG